MIVIILQMLMNVFWILPLATWMLHVLTRMEVFSAYVMVDLLEMELTAQVIVTIVNAHCDDLMVNVLMWQMLMNVLRILTSAT